MEYEEKLLLTKMRIQQWHDHWDGKIYVAFSGGKDSTVLLHIVRSMYPDVVGVFNNTGLEFPEIKKHVKKQSNIVWLNPKINYQQVVRKYGFAVISKENAQKIRELKHGSDKLKATRWHGKCYKTGAIGAGKKSGKLPEKWRFMINAPFEVSEKCCAALKTNPSRSYEKMTGLKPIVGVRSSESSNRKINDEKMPCNAYNGSRPISKPLNKWSDKDVDRYINENNIELSTLYTELGYERSGCAWCAFGVHLEKGENRFQRMKRTHPKIWNYSINKMGLKEVFDFIGIKYE